MTGTAAFALTVVMFFSACGSEGIPTVADPTVKEEPTPAAPLELIDIAKSPPLSAKGRFQDGDTADGSKNQIADDIVANGKASIPFLIAKLEDETPMDRAVINYWHQLYVGDMALIILNDLFTDRSETKSTIPGFTWDEFLERGDDRSATGEEILRRYIKKHGRRTISRRWQEMWDKNKEKIYWDKSCKCFALR